VRTPLSISDTRLASATPEIPLCRECVTIRSAALAGQQVESRSTHPGQRVSADASPTRVQVVRGGLPGLGRRR